MNKLIELKNVSYSYPNSEEKVIENLTTSFKKNQSVAIIGANGSGKSTFVKLIDGLLMPTNGTVIVDNIKLSDSEEAIYDIRKKVGMVFQNPDNQFVGSTVEEDIAFGLENLGIATVLMKKIVDDIIEELDLGSLRKKEPQYLSGGQKQKVAIAGILAMKPKVIIFDEATSMLDPKSRKEILKLVKKQCKKNNIAFIHITHYMEETLLTDRIIVMNEGQILLDNSPREVFKERNQLLKLGLDVPLTTELAARLNKQGYSNMNNPLSVEEFIKNLCI